MAGKRIFSAMEFLAAVVVVLVLIALLFPGFVDRRIFANEAAAVATLRAIGAAQLKYAQLYPSAGFADDLAKLGPPPSGTVPNSVHAGLLDFAADCAAQPCAKSGYSFAIDQTSGAPINKFRITAVPQRPGETGFRGFCSAEPGIITADAAGGTSCSIPIT
ncbi:MAG TPA: hypothetical protein VK699_01715 [Terriglobales bacterium]|jgi:type IV pilus assembly protein PilA|nr:hypothetical protein [Terriglobales bacterium]